MQHKRGVPKTQKPKKTPKKIIKTQIVMSETIYPKGITCFKKSDKAPDFVIGQMVISLNDLVQWAKEHPELLSDYKGVKQLKLNMAFTKEGRPGVSVDTWKPEPKADAPDNSVAAPETDLPF